jgi:hypothetical protein
MGRHGSVTEPETRQLPPAEGMSATANPGPDAAQSRCHNSWENASRLPVFGQ